jgi:hypothetical protein
MSLTLGIAGCKNAQTAQVESPAQDPAAANLAPVSDTSYNAGAPQQASQPAPAPRDRPQHPDDQSSDQDAQYASGDNYDAGAYDNGNGSADYNNYDTPVEYASDPPPQLPDYQQPPCPGDDYMWTPGYWDYYNGQGYYWVPGAWVLAPYAGALWTPSWWGFDRGRFGLHRGFWGRHIGYYGGIDYGHGYEGRGYEGGYWRGDHFSYNRTVNNINMTVVHNVYNYNVTNINNTRISYNGGRGGIGIRPRPAEIAALREQHNPPMTAQLQQAQQARSDRQNFSRVNNGRPAAPVVSQPLPADRDVRPPAPVNYQAQQQRAQQQRPVESGKPAGNPPPEPFHNNVHPVPEGPHVIEEHRPAQGAPAYPRNQTPTQQPNRPQAPENNHQPAPGRPMVEHPAPPPQQPQPARPAPARPAPPPAREPQQRQPQPERPAPTPPPSRPEPQRVEPSRPAPPPQERVEPTHPAPPPPQHPAPEKKPKEPKPN